MDRVSAARERGPNRKAKNKNKNKKKKMIVMIVMMMMTINESSKPGLLIKEAIAYSSSHFYMPFIHSFSFFKIT
jgi:hypothetical protein